MLSPRLTNCSDCGSIPALLSDIDCKLKEMAQTEYNNIVFSLGYSVSKETIDSLLNYKRILLFKYCNPHYASCYSVRMIASRIKLLIHK